jgi:hypothetical protein
MSFPSPLPVAVLPRRAEAGSPRAVSAAISSEVRAFMARTVRQHHNERDATACDIVATSRKGRPMSQQLPLVVDSLNDAVRDTCRVIGFNEIALELWPKKGAKEAARYLNDCLNPERPHKLDGEEIVYIAKRGREAGLHLITSFICMETGYAPPVPVDPDDARAEMQRQFVDAVNRAERLGKLIAGRT